MHVTGLSMTGKNGNLPDPLLPPVHTHTFASSFPSAANYGGQSGSILTWQNKNAQCNVAFSENGLTGTRLVLLMNRPPVIPGILASQWVAYWLIRRHLAIIKCLHPAILL